MPKKNKPYTVKITETAWEMLVSHARFLANVSVPAANRLIDTFVEVTDSLAAMPERGPTRWVGPPRRAGGRVVSPAADLFRRRNKCFT